jgi:DNA-binding winged helix-turn-helix (wHTH) protein
MPDTLRLADGSYMRRTDVTHIVQLLYGLQCVEVVGFSNIGKSALMRLLAQLDVWTQELGEAGSEVLPVYIDCNHMLALSDHGFYELVLRSLQEHSPALAALPDLSAAYATVIAPSSEFQVPLSFNRGMNAVLQSTPYKLILLLDEFDEPFGQIDSRVFINLRALKDRYSARLAYVTATEQPLVSLRTEDHCGEFCELFSHHTWRLAPLTHSDVERYVRRYSTAFEIPFTAPDLDFIYEWAGGHPRLLNGVCRVLERALEAANTTASDATARWELHQQVALQLRQDEELAIECDKIWRKLGEREQAALAALTRAGSQPDEAVLTGLLRQHLVLKIENKYQPFCRLLSDYVQRKTVPPAPQNSQLWLDAERGEVLVNGRPVEPLTNLEYRLLSLLFEQRDKLIDKYQIVTHVWGESFIDEVDDARIEKLISRVRQKIEADPSNPKFLTTVRGRGYRLVIE